MPSQDMLPQVTPTTQLDTAPSQGPNQAPNLFVGVSSRGRVCRTTQAMADSIEQQDLFSQPGRGPTAFEVTFDKDLEESDDDQEYTKHLDIQDRMRHPMAFWSEMCGDVMYFAQAMRQPNHREFVESVIREVNGHVENQNLQLVKCCVVPAGEPIQQSVWAMRCKPNHTAGEVVKHKAGLNLHGGMQEYGVNYYYTHAPVVTWLAICLMIVFAIYLKQALRQLISSWLTHKHPLR